MQIVQRTASEVPAYVTKIINTQLIQKKNSILGLATGSTQLAIYKYWVEEFKQGRLDFSQVISFNLDEYVNLPATDPGSYNYYMKENLFQHINIDEKNTYIPNGMARSLQEECAHYEQLIEQFGGVDLQILGIGHNGHIGFNEPSNELLFDTHVTRLSESTRIANSRFFDQIEQVPTQAITMGMGTIFKAKKIILIAMGVEKSDIVKQAFFGNITTQLPASLLQLHRNIEVIVDTDCGKLLPNSN